MRAKEQPIIIDELMTFNITAVSAVPHSLGIPYGLMTKTDKSKLVEYLTADADDVRLPHGD